MTIYFRTAISDNFGTNTRARPMEISASALCLSGLLVRFSAPKSKKHPAPDAFCAFVLALGEDDKSAPNLLADVSAVESGPSIPSLPLLGIVGGFG
jgi:hypothetical protein